MGHGIPKSNCGMLAKGSSHTTFLVKGTNFGVEVGHFECCSVRFPFFFEWFWVALVRSFCAIIVATLAVLGLGLSFKSTFCDVCRPLTLTIKEQTCLEGSGELTPHFGDTFAHFRRPFPLPYTTSKTATHTTPNH